MKIFDRLLGTTLLFAAVACNPALAQDAASTGSVTVELNALVASDKGCKLTFLAGNSHAESFTKVSFEFVLFDEKGLVERMAVLDFRDLPAGKTKVRQFDLPGTKCDAVKSVLINDAPACTGEGVVKETCMKSLKTDSKTAVELKG